MSYDHNQLFAQVFARLQQTPRMSLHDASRVFGLSLRTIQKAVHAVTGAPFRDLQERILMDELEKRLLSQPPLAIKEISFALGYKSARSFSRAVRRASGLSPEEFRSFLFKRQLAARPASISAHVVVGL